MKYKISELAKVSAGQSAPQGESNYSDFGTPFVKAGDLKDLINGKSISEIQKVTDEIAKKHKLKLYPKNSILFAKSGMSCTKGYVYTLPQDAYVVSHLAIISPKIKNISIYLNYYFRFFKPSSLIKDQSYPSISLTDIKNMDVDIPEETKRVEICDNLKLIEKIIRLYKKELANLEALIKARFVEMFGDPISNSKGLPTTEFINVVKLQRGFDLPVNDRNTTGNIPVYGSNGILGYHDEAKLIGGGIITGRSGTIGEIYATFNDCWPLNTTLFSIDTHENNIIFLKWLLKLFDLSRFMEGSGVPTLNRNIVHKAKIIDIPKKEQNKFSDFAQHIDKSKFFIFRIQACYNIFIQIDFNSQIF
jgi:type I restriction enzyme S subunit